VLWVSEGGKDYPATQFSFFHHLRNLRHYRGTEERVR
jgi:hypothetical protein